MADRPMARSLTPAQQKFLARLQAQRDRYHLEHPFESKLRAGVLTRDHLRGWVANRIYYQMIIPRKDAAILSQCPDADFRRSWIRRIHEQDATDGGQESWLRFGEFLGWSRDELISTRFVLPGVKFAVDSYLQFARQSPWQEGVCACLTELFAGEAHRSRIEAFLKHYPWIPRDRLRYFEMRCEQVRVDVDEGLRLTLDHFANEDGEKRALEIMKFKLDILWAMAEAIHYEYVEKGKRPWRH